MLARTQLRVLVIEDNRDISEMLCVILGARGHLTETASSGDEALACARRFKPEIVICDIGLPGVPDGFGVAAALRAEPAASAARLIAFTAYSGMGERARAAGFDHYLVKPAPLDKLLSLVEGAA